MGSQHRIITHILDQNNISLETISEKPIIEIVGERRVLVEKHLGIATYGQECILVNMEYGSICICGNNLEIVQMTKDQLLIIGKIDSVRLNRRK